jgi:hypothetical protein
VNQQSVVAGSLVDPSGCIIAVWCTPSPPWPQPVREFAVAVRCRPTTCLLGTPGAVSDAADNSGDRQGPINARSVGGVGCQPRHHRVAAAEMAQIGAGLRLAICCVIPSTPRVPHSPWMRGRQDGDVAPMKRDARCCRLAPASANYRGTTGDHDDVLPLRSPLEALVRLGG